MVFEKNGVRVVVPLDPYEGVWYTKLIHEDYENENIDHIYKLTAQNEDWINPTTNGIISWEKDNSCNSDSGEEMDDWQNWLHEVSMFHCNTLMKYLCCIPLEVRNLPYYDGIGDVSIFLDEFERDIPKEQRF